MAGERNFLRVPPDSTGKRVRLVHNVQIAYTNKTNGYVWKTDRDYTLSDGETLHVHEVYESSTTAGVLDGSLSFDAVYSNYSPAVGTTIIDPDTGATVATLGATTDIYVNATNIVGKENPAHGVDVDATGSMNVRFSEGLPQLDAFGKLRTSGATILGDYVFSENFLPQYFTTTVWGRGRGSSVSHDINRHTLTLTTPSTVANGVATTDPSNGEMTETNAYSATHTSDTYHHYFPGFSQMAIMTVALGSTGAPGLAQRWGYFDDKNGYFFQVYDDGGLEFVIRSSATGNLTERRMSRTQTTTYSNGVLQTTTAEGWSGDPVDGTGDSAKVLNVTNDNIYWIDIQWLGAGRIRFGTYHQGQRVVIHEYYHDTNGGFPHSQTGSLPLRFQQYNIANATVATGPNYLRVWCASVVTESAVDLSNQGFGQVESFEVTFDPSNLNDYKGLNDTGMGDRTGVTKTGCTATIGSTTMTVPNVTGIKPGYRLHVMSGGTGTLDNTDSGTTVLEIVDSTTVILNRPVSTAFDGNENVRFHLNVDHEYHMIGLLSPVRYIGSQTTNKNRTVYQPKSMQAWAYHEDGTDAFCEIEVYTQPIVSGNDKSMTTSEANGGALTKIEINNPFAGTNSYQYDGLVNYFGSGYHNSVNFCKGRTETIDISNGYGNYQAGAFKLAADDGGNNRCPIARVYQSSAAGVATVVQINTPPTGVQFTNHRENETALYFEGIPGAIGNYLNYSANGGKKFYVRHLDIEKLELYEDQAFTVPLDTSQATTGLDPATNTGGTINLGPAGNQTVAGGLTWPGNTGSVPGGGFIISGYGDQLYFAIVAKPVGPSATENWYKSVASGGHGPITVHFKLTWNEINQ